MPLTQPTPLQSLTLTTHNIPPHSLLPNNPSNTPPLLFYHAALPPDTSPSAIEAHLMQHNLSPQWRYTMYATTHYHSTTHEVLAVFRGAARLLFGGEENPGRVEEVVRRGDVMVVPAGVAHRLVEDLGEGGEAFEMVGAYPRGCAWDMCYGREGEEAQARTCRTVEWLEMDPVYGKEGPVFWGREELQAHQRAGG